MKYHTVQKHAIMITLWYLVVSFCKCVNHSAPDEAGDNVL